MQLHPLSLRGLLALLFLLTSTLALAGHTGGKQVTINELKPGDGAEATPFSTVKVHYTGWLTDGTKFDSSRDRGEPLSLQIGAGQVIPGWEQGLLGMRVGGKRELIIPPELAYGEKGVGGVIPANATLRFEVELMAVTPPKFTNIDNAALKEKIAAGVKVIDIRRPDEWQQTGVIPGSKLLTAFDGRGRFVRTFPEELAKLVGQDEEFVLICRTGNRSSVISNALSEQLGYRKIDNVERGIVDWIKAGGQVTKQF